MKDLHCHLLYGIDDGCRSIDESLSLLSKMKAAGTTELILTPHYIENSDYVCNNKQKQILFQKLKDEAEKLNIDIKMYLGNEVFYTDQFVELIDKKEIMTLNNSRYLLFEFPMNNQYHGMGEILSRLISKGYIPVLAHPERYKAFQECPDLAEEYLRMGVLLQGNSTSLLGKYGRTPKKVLKYFIKKGWISFLGSDTHHEVNYDEKKIYKKISRLNKDEKYIKDILEDNFDRVINNEDIAMIR